VKILLATDAFPPLCGGSGWSTCELARGLRSRGHDVLVVQPRPGSGAGLRERTYDGLRVIEAGFPAPSIPFVRNYWKNERLWARLSTTLDPIIAGNRIDLVHAQHVLTTLPSIEAAHRAGIPAVCTVRDYWPVCYWADLIHTKGDEGGEPRLCPACSAGGMRLCLRARAGVTWPIALPMIPYMRANLARKRHGLAAADTVVAVSRRIAADLRARAPELARTPIEVIPNAVDVADLDARAAASQPPMEGPYALYVGKLAPNKGTNHLVPLAERAALDWPLIIAGDGPDRPAIALQAARSDRVVRLVGWLDRDETTRWLAHASLLVFPSRGPESLSRVLLEASALGIAIAAMNTGGTSDIIEHGKTGFLSDTPSGLADDVRKLRADAGLRSRLGAAARASARDRFDTPRVIARIEDLYARLTRVHRRAGAT
jgi:glycosyltransferase involved in cell wall biosynthesis